MAVVADDGRGELYCPADRQEALLQALAIMAGRQSRHHNIMLEVADPENRTQTLVHIAQADAADVVAMCALANTLVDSGRF